MNIEELRIFCLSVKGATESLPFDDTILVFKVMGKVFALASLEPRNGEFSVNLKCEPEQAVELRERYRGVVPGWHMNKKYWNTVFLSADVSDEEIRRLILHSVEEVIKKLPRKAKEEYLGVSENVR